MSKNCRELALDVLIKVGDRGAFSHLLIDHTLKSHNLDVKDKALFTEIVYGTLNRKLTLAYDLQFFVKDVSKIESWVKWLLYLSIYQYKYLDKVPDHAIVNEAVNIAKKRGHTGIVKFVNGVLRNIQRKGFTDYSELDDPIERLAIETSHPYWMIERWSDAYGEEKARSIAESNLIPALKSVRVNPLKITREEAMAILTRDDFEVEHSPFSEQGLVIKKGQILSHPLFREGKVTIQDQSSMLVAEMMAIEIDQQILDACSAPGGKATHIAEKLNNTGRVYAYDLHEKKTRLVSEKAEQLGLINIKTKGLDARQLRQAFEEKSLDRVLVDAPCSGLGVIRTKPDIKYTKTADDVEQLAMIQYDILHEVSALVSEEGKLIYSTCTVDPTENEVIVAEFLTSHQGFEVDPDFFNELPEFLKGSEGVTEFGLQLFPDDYQTDGFFLTRLKRRKNPEGLGNIL